MSFTFDTITDMNTGEKIMRVRRKKKITQAEMADALNISQRAYSKIENNEVQLKIGRLEEIAELLHVDTKDLLPDLPNQTFENVQYSQIGNGKFINQKSDREIELYEKIIARQQEEIEYLKGLINIFKE